MSLKRNVVTIHINFRQSCNRKSLCCCFDLNRKKHVQVFRQKSQYLQEDGGIYTKEKRKENGGQIAFCRKPQWLADPIVVVDIFRASELI